ncbi:MAG: MFS transporter [Archangium sp.]|nr:MFS transporter [Archangium sp.]MDP3574519.1 MFS transporter [Archangium sp.]
MATDLDQPAERRALYLTAFFRALTTSLLGVLLGVFLARQHITGAAFGAIVSSGLVGAALAAICATFFADRWGRRRFLIVLSLLSVGGTVVFAFSASPLTLALAAFFGMLNGMGKDRGAALILEQAVLPGTTSPGQRTQVIAWYTMLQDFGHAAGALLAGLPTLLEATTPLNGAEPHRVTLLACAALGLVSVGLYSRLGSTIEAPTQQAALVLTAHSRSVLQKISALFAIDALAGGFLTTALLSFFFFERFSASAGAIGVLFFFARLMNALSHLGAAWLARRIGLVNTMVFTHVPSSLLLVTVAFAPNFFVAAALFLLREGLVEMDVPTRQSYVMAVVQPGERTFASGITNLVRLASWAVAPAFAGALMVGDSMYLPLVIGAAMKISYDVLLWRAFRGLPPPEEVAVEGTNPATNVLSSSNGSGGEKK